MFKFSTILTLVVVINILVSCSPKVIDDFFGIQMQPDQIKNFKIVSYSPQEGAKYASNMYMNPSVFAYAEFATNTVHIKIGNFDSSPISINYNLDEFYIYTKDEKIALSRGDRERYSEIKEIKPNEFIELDLELPTNFLDTIGMTNPQSHNANYTIQFWKGQNSLNMVKEKIKYIEVNIGTDITIILKPIPNTDSKDK